MKALLKLINSEENANKLLEICKYNGLKITHKKLSIELDSLILRQGWFYKKYGGIEKIGIGNNFHTKWQIEGSIKKQFSNVSISLDKSINREIAENISIFVKKNEGQIVSKDKCNLYIKKGNQIDQDPGNHIQVSLEELLMKFPLLNPKTNKIKKKISIGTKKIIKNLKTRDLDKIEKTIKDISSNQEEIDKIISGVKVNNKGEIERGKQFEGSKPALSYSDLGLLNLLSISKINSKGYEIRNKIKRLDLNLQEIPIIEGFESLEHLTISIVNEKELKIKDLRRFGAFKNLKTFTIKLDISIQERIRPIWESPKGQKVIINSLKGLFAPNLEFLSAFNLGIKDIKSLVNSPKIKYLSLDRNYELNDLSILSENKNLEKLFVSQTSIKSLKPLSNINKLKIISFTDCNSLMNLDGLEKLNITMCQRGIASERFNSDLLEIEVFNGVGWFTEEQQFCQIMDKNLEALFGDYKSTEIINCSLLESIKNIPALNTKKLTLDNLNIDSLSGIEKCGNLEVLKLNQLSSLNNINSLSNCKKLVSLDINGDKNLLDFGVISNLNSLKFLRIWSDHIEKIGTQFLPDTLEEVEIYSSSLKSLPDFSKNLKRITLECKNLKSIKFLKKCCNLNSISRFHLDLENCLDLSKCISLKNLDGLENKLNLKRIIITPNIENLDAINNLKNIEIEIMFGVTYYSETELPIFIKPKLACALSKIENLKLIISEFNYPSLSPRYNYDLSNLANLNNIISLNLDRIYIKDLNFISLMDNLNYIKLPLPMKPSNNFLGWEEKILRNDLSKVLKKRVFDNEGQIAKLKMKLLAS